MVCHFLHRCFSQAISGLFFQWLLPADVPQFPGVCVVLPTEPNLSDALDILQCRCLFKLEGLQHCTSLTSLCSCQATWWWFPSTTGLPASLLAGSSGYKLTTWAAQSSFLWCLKWTCVIAVECVPNSRINFTYYSGSQILFPRRVGEKS